MSETRQNSHQRGYNHRWRRARITWLSKHPLCVMCEAEGKLTAANIVDHIIPHKGDTRLFWDTSNWQSLCEQHHNKAKQIEERAADKCSFNNNGLPDDPNHPWNDSRWSDNDQ